MARNGWSACSGMGGRHAPEWVVDMDRNGWSACSGILWNWADSYELNALDNTILTYFGLFVAIVCLRAFHLYFLGKRLDAWITQLEREGHL